MANLGIVYQQEDIREILSNWTINQDNQIYVLVGIAFSKKTEDQIRNDRQNFGTSRNFENKVFNANAIYYSANQGFLRGITISVESATNLRPVHFAFSEAGQNERIERIQGIENRGANQAAIAQQEEELRDADYEFWDGSNGFVFFSAHEMNTLISNSSNHVTLTGASIDYGSGINNYRRDNANQSTRYNTLKAESDAFTLDEFSFSTAVGLPCPPIWGDGRAIGVITALIQAQLLALKLDFPKKGLPEVLINALNINDKTIKRQWTKFVVKFLSDLKHKSNKALIKRIKKSKYYRKK